MPPSSSLDQGYLQSLDQGDLQYNSIFNNDSPNAPPSSTPQHFITWIKTLNLFDKYPQKLHLVDALAIRLELLNANNILDHINMFPYLILQKIMMYDDYRPLCKLMAKKNTQFKIHPVDILLALLHCCDNILRQDLLSRLHTCKLAIPLLLPDPYNKSVTLLLWAIRSVVCEWKCKIGPTVIPKESRIVDHKGPIISFLRVGAKSPKDFSKSRMLNAVIGEENYFFHWNCECGNFSRKFVNGLVELSCYLPSGKENDSFSDAIIFLNLRGESRENVMQLNYIKKITFMTFVLFLEDSLDDSILSLMQELAILPGGLVIMFPDYEQMCTLQNSSRLLEMMSEKNIDYLNFKDKNEDEIKSHIQAMISQKIQVIISQKNSNPFQFSSISECKTLAQKIGISIDEEDMDCKNGYESAIQMLNSIPDVDAKAQMLPLQGPELWHKWAKYDKESFQKPTEGNVTIAYFNKTVHENKREIRLKQMDHVKRLTPLMKCFTNSLQLQVYEPSTRTYTLKWLKLFLDDRSRKILPGLRTEYEQTREEFQNKKKGNSASSAETKDLMNKLKKQNRALIEGSLGLEHLFRELGQIYEAVKHCNDQHHAIDCYPKIMVEILNQGYPVELMDGDASHVPMNWISAILEELKGVHKTKKVFVISVLGIQSTGKSTLLNTMFGLQFNVSAGRCTRGAFIQLLPVNSNELACDYVLIIDTEGLRAPELSLNESFLHDNELATFVIGLADVAIINIYGEAPGDLNDILQTAVHAFIRMKNISMNLSCHFVHQNVPAVLVDSKIKFGQQMFQDKLNEMTKYAAIAEHCETKYSSFNDVIKFDELKDITYFPGLWKGDPPMAPVNSGYSHKALQLKSTLMALIGATSKHDSNFSNFHLTVKTLWNAVCRENYIFSFKNTKEVVAYNELDAAFSQWSWILHRKTLEWQHQTRNVISNCPSSQVSSTVIECQNKADSILQETYPKLVDEMTRFFENSERSDTLAQWRARYETRLKHVKDDCRTEAKDQCELLKRNREGHLKLENIQKNYRKQLLQQIQQLVKEAKQKKTTLTSKQLERKFDEKWQHWIKEFPDKEYQSMYASDIDIEIKINQVLQQLLAKYDSILLPKLKLLSLPQNKSYELDIVIVPNLHLQLHTDVDYPQPPIDNPKSGAANIFTKLFGSRKDKRSSASGGKQMLARKASDAFFAKAKDAFCKIKQNFHNFDKSYAFDLLKEFIDDINSYNERHEYMFTPDYIVDMALVFAGYMTTEFIALVNDVKTQNDPILSFQRLRSTYFNTFVGQYKHISDDGIAARNLCQLLSAPIEKAVIEILATKIVDKMKSIDSSFKQKKLFKVKVLKDLTRENSFAQFKTYLRDIKSSFVFWAEEYVRNFCVADQKKNLVALTKSTIQEIISTIIANVKNVKKNIPIKRWLQNFHKKIIETVTIDLDEMEDIIGAAHVGHSTELFVQILCEELSQEEEKIIKAIVANQSSKLSDIAKWTTSPHIILCSSLIGCTAQCPFCGEQCEITDPNHVACGKDHFTNIHRPSCLGTYRWNESRKLVLDLCTVKIESNRWSFKNPDTKDEWVPYKDYRTIYKHWYISNNSSTEAPIYWQWFISHFYKDIIQWLGAEETPVDDLNWKAVTQEMAVASLAKIYT